MVRSTFYVLMSIKDRNPILKPGTLNIFLDYNTTVHVIHLILFARDFNRIRAISIVCTAQNH